jgi:hypothetical protein
MPRALTLFVTLALSGGCSGTRNMAGPDTTDLALAALTDCNITMTGDTFNGHFIDCSRLVSLNADEELQLHPARYSGDAISMLQVAAFLNGTFEMKSYALADLDTLSGIIVLTQNQQMRFTAGRDAQGVVTGNMTLTLSSLPVQPASGVTDWTDTSIHGRLTAQLVHDDTTPGKPGATVQFDAIF